MDLAAQKISSLAQRILPQRPHHLSLSPDRRYPVPPDFLEHHSNLQYSTFLSDTDRGILLTRPYYEIQREEPESCAPSPASAVLRQEAKKAGTKMTLKDYHNNKKKPSPSPPDAPAKLDGKQGCADDARLAAKDVVKHADGSKRKPSDAPVSAGVAPREDLNKRPRNLSREGPVRNGRSPSPDTGRRSPDLPDGARPLKKPRIENMGSRDISRTPKHDLATSKHTPSSVDRPRSVAQQPVNGRTSSATHKGGSNGAISPSHRPTVNGLKASNGSSSGVRRVEPPSKPAVPPLLSPLRLGLDDDNDTRPRSPAKRPGDLGTSSKPIGRDDKTDGAAIVPPRKSLMIPPLLSPTLPAAVEEELEREFARAKKSTSKDETSQADSPGEEDQPRSKIVVLKYKKKNSLLVSRLLALKPASSNEAMKKERSMSVEVASPPAKKRPRPTEAGGEPAASKRSKMAMDSISVTKPPAPSTPLKPVTMSRAASSNSLAQTPGDGTGLTPGAPDRPSTSHDGESARTVSTGALQRIFKKYTTLGSQLKHKRDDILRPPGSSVKVESSGLSSMDKKRVAALSLEMIMSYMVAFESMNQLRSQDRKAGDFGPWETLLPHLGELKAFVHSFPPLDGLRLQLHAIVMEELMRVYYQHDISTVGARLQQHGKKIYNIWLEAHTRVSQLGETLLKADLGPWTKPGGAAAAALEVLRRWAASDGVEWQPVFSMPVANGT